MVDVDAMTDEQVLRVYEQAKATLDAIKYNGIRKYFPDEGPLSWREYKKHYQFWALGTTENERALIAANRTGKTIAGAFEVTSHLTGDYRWWWPGVVFRKAIDAWAAGDTTDTVRDILQPIFLGDLRDIGSGMIPKQMIDDVVMRRGGNAVDTVRVRHQVKGFSNLQFKSYEMGRAAFQGTKKQVVLLDEEPKLEIYAECLLRTMATGDSDPGHMLLTFTPLLGMSETVLKFMPGGRLPEERDETGTTAPNTDAAATLAALRAIAQRVEAGATDAR